MKKYMLYVDWQCIAYIEQIDKGYSFFEGKCFQVTSWTNDGKGNYVVPSDPLFVSEFSIRPDEGSHVMFYGEDSAQRENENNSYYYIGDFQSYIDYMRYLWFIYECANMYYSSTEYYNSGEFAETRRKKGFEELWLVNPLFKDLRIEVIIE